MGTVGDMRVAAHLLCIALALFPIINAGDEVGHVVHSLDAGSDFVTVEEQQRPDAASLAQIQVDDLGEERLTSTKNEKIGRPYIYSRCWFVIRSRDSREKRAKVKQALAVGKWKPPPKPPPARKKK